MTLGVGGDGDAVRTWTTASRFAGRVRILVALQGWSLATLAEKASLDPSLVSRLLSEREDTRRLPQMEHVLAIARVLGVSPADLVVGTEVAHVLGDWVPRRELEAEVERRLEAQRAVLTRESDLAARASEAMALRSELNMLRHDHREASERAARAEAELRTGQSDRRVAVATLRSEREIAEQQREDALALFAEAQKELQDLRSRLEAAQRAVEAEQRTRGEGFVAGALLGGVIGAVLASRSDSQRAAMMSTPGAWAVGLSVREPAEMAPPAPDVVATPVAVAAALPSASTEGASERRVVESVPEGPRRSASRGKVGSTRKRRGTE